MYLQEIIGTIVLTAYNNKTYRIDDVDFNSNPMLTFKQKDRDVTYVDYYRAKYYLSIRDKNQPMLVSNPKPADIRAGRTTVIFLVPELCRATGLTDKMRTNFQMMKAMADHTQMDPERRRTRLQTLTERLYNTPESVMQLSRFDMELDRNILRFGGRALNQETILFGFNRT